MKTAEQIAEKLWEKHSETIGFGIGTQACVERDKFLAALREYGELVRQRAADLTFKRTGYAADAAAIERMPLP